MFRYEYRCEDGHITELRRAMVDRNSPVPCDDCSQTSTRIMSVPSAAAVTRNYEGGMKIAPWTLPPVKNKDGSVAMNRDGSIKMQQVEVGSRREYLNVLKRNGLTELETTSDHLIQGGVAQRDRKRSETKKLDDESSSLAKTYAEMQRSPDRVKKVIDAAKAAGERVRELTPAGAK